MTYQLANALALLLVAELITLGRGVAAVMAVAPAGRALRWLGCCAAALFLAGCNEILMLILDIGLVLAFIYAHRYNRPMLAGFGAVALSALAGTMIVLMAPGNGVRLQLFAGNRDLAQALAQSGAQTLRLLATWLSTPVLWLFAWLSLQWVERAVPAQLRVLANHRRVKWIALLAFFILIAACLFPSYWSTGQAPPPRARALPLLLFCLAWPLLFWLFLRNALADLRLSDGARGVLGFVLIAGVVWSPSAQQWFRDIGGSYRYRQELQGQREAIADALAGGQRDLILPAIVNQPKSLTAPEMQLTADGNNYANQCFARYYGLNSVAFKPPTGRTK